MTRRNRFFANLSRLRAPLAGLLTLSLALFGLAGPASADTQSYTTAGASTWTAPVGVTSVTVEVWGAGGGGGGVSNASTSGGGGGGGGGYSKAIVTVVPGTDYSVVVGTAGTAGGAGTNGGAGGDSYFKDAATVMAKGGGGGTGTTNATPGGGGTGGAAASGVANGTSPLKYSGGGGYTGAAGTGGGGGGSAGTGSNGTTATSATGATAVAGGGNGGNGGANAAGAVPTVAPAGGGGGGGRTAGGAKNGGAGFVGKVVLTWTVTIAPPSTITACSGCHKYPSPLTDATARNTPEGDFIGDHAKHNYACSICHQIPATTTSSDFDHQTGVIDMKGNATVGYIGGPADNGTYSKTVAVTQTNTPSLTGTCSAVDCHANAVTPIWGSGTTACNSCHALPPNTDAHTKHYSEKGWTTGVTTNCTVCHPDNTVTHSDVADGVVQVIAGMTPGGTSPAITCGSAFAAGCHIDKVTPAWNTTNIACLACHTLGGASNNPVSALHDVTPSITGVQHDDAFGSGGTCTSCHTTLQAQATHANGAFTGDGTVAGDRTAMGLAAFYTTAGTNNNGTCSTTSCHLGFSDDWAHQWDDTAGAYTTNGTACGGCHGDWVRGWNTGVIHRTTAGTQSTHGDGGTSYQCYECHALEHAVYPFTFSTNDWRPAGGTSLHGNSGIEVNSSGTSYNVSTGYCTACHTSGTYNFADTSWTINSVAGATVVSTCNSCHGGDNAAWSNKNFWPGGAGATAPDRAGEHEKHITALMAQLGYSIATITDQQQVTMCAYCHTYTTAPGESGHADASPAEVGGFNPQWSALDATPYPITADGGTAAAWTPGNGTGGSCSGIDCHFNKATPAANEWYDASTGTCVLCHSDYTADASHTAHTGAQATYGGALIGCTNCHGAGTSASAPPTAGHVNGTFTVAGSTTFTYTGVYPTKGTCGVNQCHNNGKNVATPAYTWGTPLTGCAQCHGDTAVNLTSQAHPAHLSSSSTFGLNIACGACHPAATATTHFDGTINLPGTTTFTYTGGDVAVTGTTYGTCGTNNCHRSDASANLAPAQNPAWNAGALANCSICHLEAMTSNKHAQHLASNSLPNATNVNECFNCHNSTATSGGLATGANHINGADDLNFAAAMAYEGLAAARNGASTGAATTCNNVICHNGVTTPQWSLTVTCGSCHNTGGTGPLPSSASTIGEHVAHANNDADYTECQNCHANATAYTSTGGNAAHQNLAVDVSMAGITYTDTTEGGVNYQAADATHIDDGSCAFTSGCHGTTGSAGWAAASTLTNGCFACHGGGLAAVETGTTKPAIDAIPNPVTYTGQYATYGHGLPAASTYPGTSPGAGLTSYSGTATPGCYSCHSSAAQHSPTASTTDPFRLGAYANNVDGLCLQAGCHDTPAIASHKKSIVGGTTTWVNNYDYKCIDCHDPHGDTNYYMVRSHISAPTATNDTVFGSDTYGTPQDTAGISAVTFNSLAGGTTAGSYGVNTATNGICEVCHIDTAEVAYYRRNVNETNTHNPTGKCTSCHKHSEGFKGSGCTGCHGGDDAALSNKNYWPGGAGAAWPDRPGEHNVHVSRLALKLYNQTLAQLVADAATDTRQKTICSYCHGAVGTIGASGHDTNSAPVGQSDVPGFLQIWSGAADGGTAGSYTTPNCFNVDCHNNTATNANGSYGWYAGATSACVSCHTVGAANNPNSGLHTAGVATVSGKEHDNTLSGVNAMCEPCHTPPVYSQSGTHINGVFTGNWTIASPDRVALGLFSAYTGTADGVGTCSGAGVAAGCHSGAGDNGTWARVWNSAVHYATNGTECKGCHGGLAETDWTFGSTANITDGSVEHNRNWDGDASSGEVIGAHTGTTQATACVSCHAYGDGTYVWATHHRNGSIEMNSSVGYAQATWNCTGSCHASNTNHNLEDSGWTVAALAGPSPACTGCHNGSGTNNQFEVSATSSHTDPDGTGATYAAGGNHCAVCHFDSHATETTNTIAVNWDTRTMGTSYVTGDGKIHLKNNIGGTTKTYEAEVCWGCHWDIDVPSLPTAIKEFGGTQGVYTTGTLNQRNWFGATWTSANFAYKTAAINSFHQTQSATGVNPAIDTAHVATDVGTIGCTACHDVHRIGMNGFTPAGQPYLRGSWTSNPFKEDGAPLTGMTFSSNRGAVPRGIDGTAANTYGGWQIEQNNASFTNTDYGTNATTSYAGLCSKCHTQAGLEAMTWSGHDGAVSGFTGLTNNDILTETKRGGTTSWARGYMSYNAVSTYRTSTWVGGLRNAREWVDGIAPRDIDSLQANTPISYPAGAVTTITSPTGYQNNFHNFPCSKCHSPHASRLPRLMITNCLDVKHNTWDDDKNPSSWVAADTHTAKQLAYASTAQNCHRYVLSTDTNKENGSSGENGWNSVTPW